MAESIVIQIDLDAEKVDQTFTKIEKSADKTSKSVESAFTDKVTKRVGQFDQSLQGLSKSIEGSGDSIESIGSSIGSAIDSVSSAVDTTSTAVASLGEGVIAAALGFQAFKFRLFSVLTEVPKVNKALFASNKSLIGVSSSLGIVGASAFGLSKVLENVENDLLQLVRAASLVVAVLAGSFAAAIGFAIVKGGELISQFGTKAVGVFQDVAESFSKSEKSLTVFSKTVENFNRVSQGLVGDFESYDRVVSQTADQFNLLESDLRRAGAEIVQVGTKLGLTEAELQNLITTTAAYAKVSGKDVFDVSVRIVQALQGSAQSVQSLGIKLDEAKLQQQAFTQALDGNLDALNEGQKVFLRYQLLQKQFTEILPVAIAQTGTYADQQAELAKNTDRLNEALGAGVSVIESNNLAALALNSVLKLVNENVLSVLGFLGALGARFLQVGGLALSLSLQIFAVVKVIKVLNILLASDFAQSNFAKTLPFIGKSVNQLVQDITGLNITVKSLPDAFKVLTLAFRAQGAQILSYVSGVRVADLTLKTFARGAVAQTIAGLKALYIAILPVLSAAAPFIAAGAALIAVYKGVGAAFQFIEKRTSFFSDFFATIQKELERTGGLFSKFSEIVSSVTKSVQQALFRLVGLVAFAFANLFTFILDGLSKLPDFILSKQTKESFRGLAGRLTGLRKQLVAAGFDVSQFGDQVLASTDDARFAFKATIDQIRSLRRELTDVGLSPLQIIERELNNRLRIIKSAQQQELISDQEFYQLKSKAFLDFNDKFIDIQKQNIQKQQDLQDQQVTSLARTFNQGIVRLLSEGFERLGAAFAGSENAFDGFLKAVLGIIGDLAISIGSTLISIGLGIEKLKASLFALTGGPAIAAGLALVALGGALKAFSGGVQASATPTAAAGTQPDLEDPVTLPEDQNRENARVVVNIKGDVLDSDETGTRIAAILTEQFQAEGVDVVRSV